MEFQAVVKYRGALAHYGVSQENEGIYQAVLIRYDGRPDHAPPVKMTLVKGLNHWSGSSEKEDLIDEIGAIIDKKIDKQDNTDDATHTIDPASSMGNYDQPLHS